MESYGILLSFGSHVGVAVAPVEGQLLLLPLIEPDQLLGAVGHKSSKALQATQSPWRMFLRQHKNAFITLAIWRGRLLNLELSPWWAPLKNCLLNNRMLLLRIDLLKLWRREQVLDMTRADVMLLCMSHTSILDSAFVRTHSVTPWWD